MSKAILIPNMQMPGRCRACPCVRHAFGDIICAVAVRYIANDFTRPEWCPLMETEIDDGLERKEDDRK